MSDSKQDNDPQRTLNDAEIQTSRVDRRSMLRSLGLGSTVLFGAVFTAACGRNDRCDADVQTDFDLGAGADPANRKKDRCDADGT